MVSQSVGYDADKKIKGCKQLVTVDTFVLVIRVLFSAAIVRDRR
jgi:hypothetical protein